MGNQRTLELLRGYESPNVTYIEADGSWPIVWSRARGVRVEDADGKHYLDLTAAFGVAACGHANPRVVKAGQRQMSKLLHAMGDVHPHPLKGELARELSRLTFERWTGEVDSPNSPLDRGMKRISGKTIFCNSGFEAVEAALKTAFLATGKRGLIAFTGGYHGLGYGALNITHREHFRGPFRSQLADFGHFAPFPVAADELTELEEALRKLCRRAEIGAIVTEPIQVRAGVRAPPAGFLPMLRRICDEEGPLLVLDEIYTGFGRTGRWFACEESRTIPDLICLGKALTGGFPMSVCVGKAEEMDRAWPVSSGEAIHTSTFLGHPVGCSMALAQIQEIQSRGLVQRSARIGAGLIEKLEGLRMPLGLNKQIRGLGLLAGLELTSQNGAPAVAVTLGTIKEMLARGFILLPEGEEANVISFTPPLTISEKDLARTVRTLQEVLDQYSGDASEERNRP